MLNELRVQCLRAARNIFFFSSFCFFFSDFRLFRHPPRSLQHSIISCPKDPFNIVRNLNPLDPNYNSLLLNALRDGGVGRSSNQFCQSLTREMAAESQSPRMISDRLKGEAAQCRPIKSDEPPDVPPVTKEVSERA